MAVLDVTLAEALSLLRASPLFGVVPEDELATFAGGLALQRFQAGETVVREGERGDACYLIRAGQAGVVSRDLIGEVVSLAVLNSGDSFGEIALVTDRPRNADVRAVTDLQTYVVDRATFERLKTDSPAFAAHARHYADLLTVETFLRKASPFAGLPRGTVRRLAGQMVSQQVAPGEVVIQQGDEGDRFYVVRSGRVEIVKDGAHILDMVTGDCFGEIALLSGGKRTATVRALEETEVLWLDKPSFTAVVREDTALGRRFAEFTRIRYGAAAGQHVALPDPISTLMPFLEAQRRQHYWTLFLVGTLLFAVLTALATLSGQRPLVYAALVVGAFVGPVVYVTYLAEADILPDQPLVLVATFVLGAAFGLPVAILLERWTGAGSGRLVSALLVALIEEPAKLLGLLWLLRRRSYRFAMDGVIFGAAAGMGFAAFETMLFGLARVTMIGPLLVTLWLRTLLSPFGHGTWTAILGAVIWRQKGSGAPRWDWRVACALATTTMLHGLWDWQPLAGAANLLWFLGIGSIGLVILRTAIQQAMQEEVGAVLALNPEVARAHESDLPRSLCRVCGQVNLPGTHYCVRCGTALRVPLAA